MAVHDSVVYLLQNIPLDRSYTNSLSWASITSQQQYFYSNRIDNTTGTYQRQYGTKAYVRFPKKVDEIINCNYLMFQNTNQSSKWYYAFIDEIEYSNDNNSIIHFTIDVLQTWYFDLNYKQSFIEREHVTNDAIGANTVSEPFDTGDLFINTSVSWDKIKKDFVVIVASSVDLTKDSENFPDVGGNTYGNVYSGLRYYYFKNDSTLNNVIVEVTGAGKINAIAYMFMYPIEGINQILGEYGELNESLVPFYFTLSIPVPTSFTYRSNSGITDSYTPKNNKLLTYPYCMLSATNNQGQANTYRTQDFGGGGAGMCDFTCVSIPGPASKILMYPKNYNGALNNYENIDEAITLPAYPQCSWNYDTFNAWFAQNGASWAVSQVGSVISLASTIGSFGGAVGTGNLGGIASNGSSLINQTLGIGSTAASIFERSILPASSSGNSGGTNILMSMESNTFIVRSLQIKPEFARIIDEAFEKIGYKVNRVKQIQFRTRPQWNYIKTIGANITGNIPQNDLDNVKSIFDNGLTWWHVPENVGNYSLNNH